MTTEEGREEPAQGKTARQQAEKDPKPTDHAETDKEQAQKGGDAAERERRVA